MSIPQLVSDWLTWQLDLDIEYRTNARIERNQDLLKTAFIHSVPGSRIPKGIDYTAQIADFRKLSEAMDRMPFVPFVVLCLAYWPTQDKTRAELWERSGLKRTQFDRHLRWAENFLADWV